MVSWSEIRSLLIHFLYRLGMCRVIKMRVESDSATLWYVRVVKLPGLITLLLAAYGAAYEQGLREKRIWGANFQQLHRHIYRVGPVAWWGGREVWCVGLEDVNLVECEWEWDEPVYN